VTLANVHSTNTVPAGGCETSGWWLTDSDDDVLLWLTCETPGFCMLCATPIGDSDSKGV